MSSEEGTLAGIDNCVDLLIFRAARQGEQVAYTFPDEHSGDEFQLTYGDLDRRARAIAAVLTGMGAHNEPVLLVYPTGPDYVAAFFGCLYAGAIAVPIQPPRRNQALERIKAVLASSRSRVALTTDGILETVRQRSTETRQMNDLLWHTTDYIEREPEGVWAEPSISAESLAYLQYTSGSTSRPRGAMISHGNLIHNAGLMCKACEHSSESVGVSWLPLFHDMGLVGGVLQAIYGGFPFVLIPPESFLTKPVRWLQTITKFIATISGGPNFAYDLCTRKISDEEKKTLDLRSWRLAINGSESVRSETMTGFARAFESCGFQESSFYPCYGLAEATLFVAGGVMTAAPSVRSGSVAALEKGRFIELSDSAAQATRLVSCGTPRVEDSVEIVDPTTFERLPESVVGEVWLDSPSIARGYWNEPEATAETFCAALANGGQRAFLRTGDLGFMYRGELYITGRLKDLIIIAGRNHYPQDIEHTVESGHELIRTGGSAAFSIEEGGEERLVIVAELDRRYRHRGGKNTSKAGGLEEALESVAASIRQCVSEYHEVPVAAVCLIRQTTMAKTTSGKVARYVCRDRFQAGTLDVIHTWKRDEGPFDGCLVQGVDEADRSADVIESWIVARLAGAAGITPGRVDIDQPLAAFEVDSLEVFNMAGELAEWLGFDIPASLLLTNPTVAEATTRLVLLVEQNQRNETARHDGASTTPTAKAPETKS
ncbi:MAG: AMP-binding protein [Arenicellales bacterium]